MNKKETHNHIEQNIPQHIETIQEFIKQPSISQTGEGIKEASEMVQKYLSKLGFEGIEEVTMGSEHHPIVWGKLDVGAKKTMLVYTMYDIMPVEGQNWSVPPFEGTIVEREPFPKVLIGRGATNSKGPMMALINTIDSIIKVNKEPPINIIFISEGEEERLSVALNKFIKREHKKLRADALFFPGREITLDGLSQIRTGSEGILYVVLETSGARWGRGPTEFDIHGRMKMHIDSPAWRHIEMLSTLISNNGNKIEIEGWYDNIIPPTKEDLVLIDKMLEHYELETEKKQNKVKVFMNDEEGQQVLVNKFFNSIMNLDGIYGGLTSPGAGTQLPHKVTSKHSIRLVPEQEPEEILIKIKKHLEINGYNDVNVQAIGGYTWSKSDFNSELAKSVIKTYEEFDAKYILHPSSGALPLSHFSREPLNLPCVVGGLGHGGRAHSPDEYLVIEGFKAKDGMIHGLSGLEKSYASIIYNFAQI